MSFAAALFAVVDEKFDWVQLVRSVAILACLVAVGFYVIGRIRGRYRQTDVGAGILLDNFRELHSGGQLSDEEYRNIKSKLAAQFRDEINRTEKAK